MVNWQKIKEWYLCSYNMHIYGNPEGIDKGWGGFR